MINKKQHEIFIDTANNYCYVAIYLKDKKIEQTKILVNKNVTDIIVISIRKLLKKAKINFSNIKNIFLNIGPGSFTGIKVGIVIAKAWSLVHDVKIFVINSLLLQIRKYPSISLIDAKSNKTYLAVYDKNKTLLAPIIVDNNKLESKIKKYKKFDIVQNKTDDAYDLFLFHKDEFQECKIKDLIPLYLKNPIN